VVGVLRGRWNVNEVITSLLLNYVAIFLVGYLVRKPLGDPESFLRQTDQLPRAALLPYLHALRVHGGILVALALVPVVAYVMHRTPFGFRLDLLGSNPEAARTAGVDTARMTVLVMLVSGGLAGLAGALQVMGQETRVTAEISPGFGFTAIVVALLGRNRPLGVLVSALFIAGLSIGGVTMQTVEQVPSAIVVAVEALFVLFLLVADRMARRAG
jgi:simple sugar transport system permease protein